MDRKFICEMLRKIFVWWNLIQTTYDSVQELQKTGVLDRVKENTINSIIAIFSEIEIIEEMKSRLQMWGDSDVKNIFSPDKSDKDSAFENNIYYARFQEQFIFLTLPLWINYSSHLSKL